MNPTERLRRFVAERSDFVLPGAVIGVLSIVLGRATFTMWPPWWAAVLVVVVCASVASLIPEWEGCGEPFASIQVATSLGAVYACVPEPREIAIFLGAAVAYAAAQMTMEMSSSVRLTMPISLGIVATAGFTGAANRPSAYLGVLMCIASLLVLPVLYRTRKVTSSGASYATVSIVGVVTVVLARTIGIAGT